MEWCAGSTDAKTPVDHSTDGPKTESKKPQARQIDLVASSVSPDAASESPGGKVSSVSEGRDGHWCKQDTVPGEAAPRSDVPKDMCPLDTMLAVYAKERFAEHESANADTANVLRAIWETMENSPRREWLQNMGGPLEDFWKDMYEFSQSHPGMPDRAAVRYFLEPWLAMARDSHVTGHQRQLARRGAQLQILFLLKFDEVFALRGGLARDVAALGQDVAALAQDVSRQVNFLMPVLAQLECRISAIEATLRSPAFSPVVSPPAFLGHVAAFEEVPSMAAVAFRRERTALRERMGVPPRTCSTASQCSIAPDGSKPSETTALGFPFFHDKVAALKRLFMVLSILAMVIGKERLVRVLGLLSQEARQGGQRLLGLVLQWVLRRR